MLRWNVSAQLERTHPRTNFRPRGDPWQQFGTRRLLEAGSYVSAQLDSQQLQKLADVLKRAYELVLAGYVDRAIREFEVRAGPLLCVGLGVLGEAFEQLKCGGAGFEGRVRAGGGGYLSG